MPYKPKVGPGFRGRPSCIFASGPAARPALRHPRCPTRPPSPVGLGPRARRPGGSSPTPLPPRRGSREGIPGPMSASSTSRGLVGRSRPRTGVVCVGGSCPPGVPGSRLDSPTQRDRWCVVRAPAAQRSREDRPLLRTMMRSLRRLNSQPRRVQRCSPVRMRRHRANQPGPSRPGKSSPMSTSRQSTAACQSWSAGR